MTKRQIWEELFVTQAGSIQENELRVSSKWRRGAVEMATVLNYNYPRIEDFAIPHWDIFPIVGKAPEAAFWYRLSRGIFNVNQRLRTEENLRYLEERDLFHDTFGHLPILYDEQYTNYLRGLGVFAQYATEEGLAVLSNIYWFTSEFGLVIENGIPHAYGAGLLSSIDELEHALSSEANVHRFNATDVADVQEYVLDGFQEDYFLLNEWSELQQILKFLWTNFTR